MSARIHSRRAGWRGHRDRALTLALAVVLAVSGIVLTPEPAQAKSVKELKAELAAIRGELKAAGREFDRALWKLENTDDRIKAIDRRMAKEAKVMADTEKLLGTRADAMYRGGGQTDMMDFVLGAATWEDFVTRLDYVTLIADNDADLIARIKDQRRAMEASKADLKASRATQASQVAALRTKRNAMSKKLAGVQYRYNRVMAALAAKYAAENPSGGYYPPGPNGQCFPVRGAYYYSNTWGAARSGGRRHKGTDIMARTGTPCVATVDGVVRSKSSGLGGLTIYLNGDNGWEYYYAHLSRYVVRSGRVKKGQLIGYVGATGNARGGAPHLHFQMGPNGRWVNPYPYLRRME